MTNDLMTFILAGGLGTRLRELSGDRPKGLMPIGGQPFLQRLLERLAAQGLSECVLCLGYRADAIIAHFMAQPIANLQLHFSVETEPRGTAGALRVAEAYWRAHNFILNGDTEITFDFASLQQFHHTQQATVTIGLTHVADASRFGRVQLNETGQVRAFLEKDGVAQDGFVNAGMYLAAAEALASIPTTGAYSIEKEWLPSLLRQSRAIYGYVVAPEFIDIGTPADYWRLANQQVK